MKKINILLLCLWLIVIFLFSHQPAEVSTKSSTHVTKTVINIVGSVTGHKMNKRQTEKIIDQTFVFVRKLAHTTEYFILGLLMMNVVKDYGILDKKTIFISIVLCVFYACTDEIHQLFIPGRSGQILDVLIDSIGIILGTCFYYFIYCLLKIKKKVKIS